MTEATTETRPTFAEELRRLRLEKGLSQAEVAAEAGISRQAFIDIEKGRATPRPKTFFNLICALNLTFEEIKQLQSEEGRQLAASLRPMMESLEDLWPLWREKVKRFKREARRQIRLARRRSGLSQEGLARKVGMSQREISRLESGNFTDMSLTKLKRIADELDVDLDELWFVS